MTTERPRAPDEAVIGTVIGHYRVTGILDHGGMGAVYRAVHPLIGKQAAIKLLLPDLSSHAEIVQRFFNEAKAASAIRHPGIVEIFDFGYHRDGRAYIVMECLEGESLAQRLIDRGRLTELEAAVITRAMAGALAAAHAAHIVHRDLKPDNVFLVPDPDMPTGERTKLLDFGIAKLTDDRPHAPTHTRTGALMGTPTYMSPEQARGAGEVDARADLYSLGCMLYEMLCGQPPFLAEGSGEIIAMQLYAEPVPPREVVPELSPEIEKITMALLEKDPDLRIASASELASELGALLPRLSPRLSSTVPLALRVMPHAVVPSPPRLSVPTHLPRQGITEFMARRYPEPTTLDGIADDGSLALDTPPPVGASRARRAVVAGSAIAIAASIAGFAAVAKLRAEPAAEIAPTSSATTWVRPRAAPVAPHAPASAPVAVTPAAPQPAAITPAPAPSASPPPATAPAPSASPPPAPAPAPSPTPPAPTPATAIADDDDVSPSPPPPPPPAPPPRAHPRRPTPAFNVHRVPPRPPPPRAPIGDAPAPKHELTTSPNGSPIETDL